MKNSILLFALLFFGKISFATHIAGGEISYKYLSGLDYKVSLRLQRQCQGAAMPATNQISVSSVSLSQNFSSTLSLVSSGTITALCSSISTTCQNALSTIPGFEYYLYEGTVTLPSVAADWKFTYTTCCWNGVLMNLANSASQGMLIYASLDNTVAGGFNNSIQYMINNAIIYPINQPCNINQAGIDIDGDSIVYSLVDGIDMTGSPNTYMPGYSGIQPFGSSGSITINPSSGSMLFNSTSQGSYMISVKADEYRMGTLISTSVMTSSFVMMISSNHKPGLSGVNASGNYYTSIAACPSASLSFTVDGTDADVSDSVHIAVEATDIPSSYSLTSNGALQETITFTWSPSAADIRPQPYLLVLSASDNFCDKAYYGYLVYVNQCNTDSVWSGDANADYTADNYDVLNVGIAYNTTGIIRPSATTNWVAEYCPNWTNTFISGINYKHADCNGDGVVDIADLSPITLNYGQVHLKGNNPGVFKKRGFPNLYFDLNGITANRGSTIQVPIYLGENSIPITDFYGISAHAKISNLLSAPISLNTTSSWIGNGSNSLRFQKNISDGDLAFTLVRSDHTNLNGYGQLGTLSIPIDVNATLGSDLILQFSDVRLIKNDGTEILDYNVIHDTIQIQAAVSLNEFNTDNAITFFPNPVNDELNIFSSGDMGYTLIEIYDVLGKKILTTTYVFHSNSYHSLSMKGWDSGNYLIRLIANDAVKTLKVFKK